MNPLSSRFLLAAVLVAGAAIPASAQEQAQPAPAPGVERRAVPRAAAPRSQAPQNEPARQERVERSRGTDDQGRARAPRPEDRAERREGQAAAPEPRERAVPRAAAPQPTTTTRTEAIRQPAPESAAPNDDQRRAVPRGSRPRGDNPAVGRAEPRDGDSNRRPDRDGSGNWNGGSGYPYWLRGRTYNNYYYHYPRRWYPYGYGAFGLGYFYYDPYTWYGNDPYAPYYYGRPGGQPGAYSYDSGEVRLQVRPRDAQVYVDGYFAGEVDDFDGTFQALRLEEGPYRIEIVKPGYDTLVFNVRIQAGRKITYRDEMRPRL